MMSVSSQHIQIFRSELKSVNQQHIGLMREVGAKPFQEAFNPNRPFQSKFYIEYKVLAEGKFSSYLLILKNKVLELLDKMGIESLTVVDKDQLIDLASGCIDLEFYKSSFDALDQNLRRKYRSYGVRVDDDMERVMSQGLELNKAGLEVATRNGKAKFLSNLDNELTIFTLEFTKPQSEFSNDVNVDNFVSPTRIKELGLIETNFDLRKMIKICEELNISYTNECYFSVAMLGRSILDHAPPIFGASNFREFANNCSGRSLKKSMLHLEVSLRSIADSYLHLHIRNNESLPTKEQVEFRSALDQLIAEVIRVLPRKS